MPIYLDDEPVDLAGKDLSGILNSATDQITNSGRVIVEVALNGQMLSSESLNQHNHKDLAEAELRLYSADPRDVARSALEGLLAQLDQASDQQVRAAEQLNQDRVGEAMGDLGKAMETWQQVQQAVTQSISLIGINLEVLEIEGQTGTAIVNDLVGQLTSVRDILESRDTVSLADVLAYEWPQLVDRWKHMLTGIIELIDDATRPPHRETPGLN